MGWEGRKGVADGVAVGITWAFFASRGPPNIYIYLFVFIKLINIF
jgi:hypothetical protein